MRTSTLLLTSLALAACATTPEGIQQKPVHETYTSDKQPLDIARCMKDLLPGLDIYPGDNAVSVSSRNQFSSILINWLIKETPNGSLIEVRRTSAIAPGINKVTRCY